MCPANELTPSALQRTCPPQDVPFETTAVAEAVPGVVGQDRAVEALRFGIGIQRHGYNLFAIGPPGVGKQTLLRQYLDQRAADEPVPPDLCYVHDFDAPERPRVLELPAGTGARLQRDLERALSELRVGMRATFESDQYRTRKQQLIEQFKERREQKLSEIREHAQEREIAIIQTETGILIAPIHEGTPLDPEAFRALPEELRKKLKVALEQVGEELHDLLDTFHEWGREEREVLRALDRELATATVQRVFEALKTSYASFPALLEQLAKVERDAIDHADAFLEDGAEGVEAALRRALTREPTDGDPFRRYHVNLLVDRGEQQGAPVVYEDNPTYPNLFGRVEHETHFGALVTNFTLIRAGALHRASGGYLILDAHKVLQQPFAWEALKRAIRSGELRIESLGQALGLVTTVTLEPAPVALGRTKVILAGERVLYYLLSALDPEFLELFKVLVDFEDTMDRGPETQQTYANLVAALVNKEQLRPFDQGAVARVIEHASRAAGDAGKLSVHMRGVLDLLHEADYWAGEEGRELATAADVQRAIDAQLQRSGRVRERLQEAILREDILIATAGESTGQVNGLAVSQLGEHMFGHPTRITARVRLGKGEVIDIEREVELGGPIHSKGVLILGGFLGARYASQVPFSLSATLVFEQSYGGVEGDSASLAELCALLSALAEAPLRQSLALTGSVNQQGQVQGIGGVNEKIEGFFDVCRERGLSGEQGVLIPRTNAKNLMLRQDVVEAVEAGTFRVYTVDHVDDAIELLTGTPAGVRDETSGAFPAESINGRVEARLSALAEAARAFLAKDRAGGESKP